MKLSKLITSLEGWYRIHGDIDVVIDPASQDNVNVVLVEGVEPIHVKPTDNPMQFGVNADARDKDTVKVLYIW